LLAAEPEEVNFPSGKLMLHGFFYRPEGNGPFPTILYRANKFLHIDAVETQPKKQGGF
jgi:hypothetical protein